jgi:putative RNA 2'-phosphotransferase
MASAKLQTEISKFMSYVLRHAPQDAGLTLDAEGWVAFADLKTAIRTRFDATDADIIDVIDNNPKKRFTLDGERIRAAQGHSIDVDLALKPVTPPDRLFHGTTAQSWSAIARDGLHKMDRRHVHLSIDRETARIVAIRRKGPHVILAIDASAMFSDGYSFFVSDNGVWLTDHVPAQYVALNSEAES